MAISAGRLTYEQYLTETETNRRYEILDGVRFYMTNPTRRHQKIVGNLYLLLQAWRNRRGDGDVILAPCDVLIQRSPLRIRQPDLLYISAARLAQGPSDTDPAPLEPAPELVVEILSPSDTRRVLDEKIADYGGVGVEECWAVDPGTQTVERRRLAPTGVESVATFGLGETLTSAAFPDLILAVADLFAL